MALAVSPLTVKLPVFPLHTVEVLVAAVPATGVPQTYSYAPMSKPDPSPFLVFSAKSTLGAPVAVPALLHGEEYEILKSLFAASTNKTSPDVTLPASDPVR